MNADQLPATADLAPSSPPTLQPPAQAPSQAEMQERYREQLRRMFCPTCGEAEPDY